MGWGVVQMLKIKCYDMHYVYIQIHIYITCLCTVHVHALISLPSFCFYFVLLNTIYIVFCVCSVYITQNVGIYIYSRFLGGSSLFSIHLCSYWSNVCSAFGDNMNVNMEVIKHKPSLPSIKN